MNEEKYLANLEFVFVEVHATLKKSALINEKRDCIALNFTRILRRSPGYVKQHCKFTGEQKGSFGPGVRNQAASSCSAENQA